MPIVGFNFDKIVIEKLPNKKQDLSNVNIKNNFGIKDVEEDKIPFGNQDDILKFMFEYTVEYEPKVGSMVFRGTILYLEESKKLKEAFKAWKKDKKLPGPLMSLLLNTIITRCNIKALTFSQDVNLPPNLPLPQVGQGQKPEDYIG